MIYGEIIETRTEDDLIQYQEFGNRLWLAHGTLIFCLCVTFSDKQFLTSSHAASYITYKDSQDYVIFPFSNLKLWLLCLLKHVILKLFPPVFCFLFQLIHSLGQAPSVCMVAFASVCFWNIYRYPIYIIFGVITL